MNTREGVNKAIELALKALELDPGIAEAHAVLGDLYTYADFNWEMAEKELHQAIELNPNYSTAHQYYSELLCITGKPDKAREHINKAVELDPFSFVIRFFSSKYYYNQGNFKEALAEIKVCHDLVKDHEWAVRLEFDIYYQLGMEQEALESFRRYGTLFKKYDPAKADSVCKNEGLDGLLRVKIKTETWLPFVACWHAMLGEYEKAFDILEKSFGKGKADPMLPFRFEFNKMHDNPRYINLLKKMGLQQYQVQNDNE